MKTILKTVLAIGIFSSSSLALAEGKLAYRQPLKGVDSSPTFGMTELERQSMCLNQNITTKQVEKTRTSYREGKIIGEEEIFRGYVSDGTQINEELYIRIAKYGKYNGEYNGIRYLHYDMNYKGQKIEFYGKSSTLHLSTRFYGDRGRYGVKAGDLYRSNLDPDGFDQREVFLTERFYESVPYEEIYTIDVEMKSENYDWCVSNGYPTAN